ncbi:MAG: MotA/TolQ/ExbB proton channel family protein [Candidatus Omnitrophica bacterium]|nr:MotA/TolQ/ExbB proton channel family protein [Candidatus Omnitrophota bacterium]
MNFLTNVLYWISTGFLIPVIIFLILSFVWALLMLGSFYGIYMQRLRFKNNMRTVMEKIRTKKVKQFNFLKETYVEGGFRTAIKEASASGWHPVHSEKILADFETAGEKELEASRVLMRLGPMLGLMGTLIPMGPALVGLAAGDITSMALNMQVAFSTTVIGIFCGAAGFITQLVKKRWFVEDVNNLQYIFDLATSETK